MPNVFDVKDARALMSELVEQITGQKDVAVVDTSSYVSAGELVMEAGMEKIFNGLNIVMGRLIVSNRPFKAELKLMDALDTGIYTNRLRKVSFYSTLPLNTGANNTDLYTNFAEGYTNGQNVTEDVAMSTKSQWEQHRKPVLELNFGNSAEWQKCITLDEDRVEAALRDENEMVAFMGGYMTEHANEIETEREAWNRMLLVNKIASVYDMQSVMPGSVVNLTKEFNTKFGTNYTSDQLRTTYLKEFLAFFVTRFKDISKEMKKERSVHFHWTPDKTVDDVPYYLLRHTPYADQHVYLYERLFREAEAMVLPQIFNPEYLDIKTQYEGVEYWQNNYDEAARSSIICEPAVTDTTTGKQKKGDKVSLSYVVGMITDRDGLMSNMQLERTDTTVLEARKHYRNTWDTFRKGGISDNTENVVIFIMEDDAEPTPDPDEPITPGE